VSAQEFDIYQGPSGPTAVTHPVQRQILDALAEADRQLPDLVAITGRSKPTLSGSHMKELLNRDLVVELPHPSDSRRKVYRLNATRLGASAVPVDALRRAVQGYAHAAPGGLPLPSALQVLAAAPADADPGVLRAQARALGRLWAGQVRGDTPRAFAVAFATFAQEQGLAEHLQLDFERLTFRCRPGSAAETVPAGRLAELLAGMAEGAAQVHGLDGVAFRTRSEDGVFQLEPYRS